MEIIKGIEIVDLGLFIKKQGILIISDLQLGYEENMTKEGLYVPRLQFEMIKKRLSTILDSIKPNIILINGDLKHEFGTINRQEWKESLAILDFIADHCKEIVLVKGNHDVILSPIANKRNISLVDYYKVGDICILHGHKMNLSVFDSKILIIGHEHPAVTLRDGAKTEKYKCFLKGKYENKILIVMPSFNMLNDGSDVLREKFLGPFIKGDIYKFEAFIVEDKVYKFGKLKNIK